MPRPGRIGIVLGLSVVATMSAALGLRQSVVGGPGVTSLAEPVHAAIVRQNLQQIGSALAAYTNEFNEVLPPRLSLLCPDYLSDPSLFWSPGDADPLPTVIDNDEPNQVNSTRVSFEYLGTGLHLHGEPVVLLQDNTLSNNGGAGLYVLTSDFQVRFFSDSSPLPFTQTARTHLEAIGVALHAYADDHAGQFPATLSMLYPTYVSDPAVFWNPGDDLSSDPCAPTTIDNDVPNAANSAQISYAYHGAAYTSAAGPHVILVQDNSPSNNGGVVLNMLFADGRVATFSPDVSCATPSVCRSTALANLKAISISLYTYAYQNDGSFPLRLSMLYRASIYDPLTFWHPGDVDPPPLWIDNDDPDSPSSTQISYAYSAGRNSDHGPLGVLLQDNRLANNDGLGVAVLTVEGRAEFLEPSDRVLPTTAAVRANLEQIGTALHQFADANGGFFPQDLSELYPGYIADPTVFWNPGDFAPTPTTIDNDLRDRPNSARISYEYLGAGYAAHCGGDVILVQDNSLSNNGGVGIHVLTADGVVRFFAFSPPSCAFYQSCRQIGLANLTQIGYALRVYATLNNDFLPADLSMLYPAYVPRPTTFWNPGDSNPWPMTIDNDVSDAADSALISFDFPAAGRNLNGLSPGEILVQDNSSANNGGYSVAVVFANGSARLLPRCHDPFADADGDGDVDQTDFGVFQRCMGSPTYAIPPECECLDRPVAGGWTYFGGNGVVDQADFAAFLACVSGPAIPAMPGCDD